MPNLTNTETQCRILAQCFSAENHQPVGNTSPEKNLDISVGDWLCLGYTFACGCFCIYLLSGGRPLAYACEKTPHILVVHAGKYAAQYSHSASSHPFSNVYFNTVR